jgi:hypothetical protein
LDEHFGFPVVEKIEQANEYCRVISGEIDMELDAQACTSRLATYWCSGAPSTAG